MRLEDALGSAPAMSGAKTTVLSFGAFELDLDAGRLVKNGRAVRLQPQPFRLLCLLVSQPGRLVTREEIQAALWKDQTFVDFEQGVNFAIKQVREALGDRAESSVYIQTVPRRGYRFVAPVASGDHHEPLVPATADPELLRALWENIVDLRLSEERQRRQLKLITTALAVLAIALAILFLIR
jgi:DNA-binding winged helix-turn-helix (wHTH) protein